jgi:arsenate reductase (glutaredoxin)
MPKSFTIYHNPRCRKSRETLDLLKHHCKDITIVDYLKTPPDEKELKMILKKLGMKAEDLLRKGEELFKEKYKNKNFSEEEWIKVMVKNPVLIERPIVVEGNRAVIGRPPEKTLELL